MTRSLFLTLLIGCGRQIDGSTEGIPELVEGNDAFAVAMEQDLAAEGGNVFFSPLSVTAALGMTWAGAGGETATQMEDTLEVLLPEDEFHPLMGDLMVDLEAGWPAPYQLKVANRLFGKEGHGWKDDFLAVTKQDYRAPLEEIDFSNSAAAAAHINDWCSAQTAGHIDDILAPSDLSGDTAMVLANAIYFKGKWEHGFDADLTGDAAFTLLDGQQVQVPTMNLESTSLPNAAIDGARIVELPYKGGDIGFVLIVPDETDGLPAIEAALTGESLAAALDGLNESEVVVSMPKLELRYERLLNADLQALGMVDAFDPAVADFSRMSDEPIVIDKVLHEAWMSLDEQGTEAAAVTLVVANDLAFQPSDPIRADHPFLFAIRDRLTGSILFMGRVEDPTAG